MTLSITFPGALPSGRYYKYGPTPTDRTSHWYEMPATISGNTVTMTITDGGLGDDDLSANGVIVDAGGVGVFVPEAIPTLSEWALLLLAGLVTLLAGINQRRRNSYRIGC